MKRFPFLIFILLLFSARPCLAVSGANVFIIDSIHEIRLTFKQQNFWDTLIHNYEIKHGETDEAVDPIPAKMSFDGKELDSIGVKLKASFSYSIPGNKKPIKLDFNAFVKGRRFDGLTALNLSNEFPDPTLLRNTVAFKVLREAGVTAPRTSYARVYLNDVYRGLYVLIEQIDKTFISDHYNRQGAELVKAMASPLYYQELDTMSYYSVFEIKVKDQPESWTHLIDLGRKINKIPHEIIYDSLKNFFDFAGFIKVFAADIVFNNWDSYLYGQNYYLLRDSVEGKYYFLPWDYNLSMNVYEISGGNFDLNPGGEDDHYFKLPLPEKVMANKYLYGEYLKEVRRVNDLMLGQVDFILRMHKVLRPALAVDKGRGFTMQQYDSCLEADLGTTEIPMVGLVRFIKNRNRIVNEQLKRLGH